MPRTNKITNFEGREYHGDISTAVLGGTEPIILSGNSTQSVIGIKPGFGQENDPTGVTASFVITEAGSAGTEAIISLQITGAPTSAGDISLALNGEDPVPYTLAGTESASDVAAMIRAAALDWFDWTLSGTGDTVIFTAIAVGEATGANAFVDTDTTGCTASITVTEAGEAEVAAITTMQITHAAGSAGDISVSIDDCEPVVFELAGTETADQVATLIRASEDFVGWTLTGATDTIIFTADAAGLVDGANAFVDVGAMVSTNSVSVQLQYTIDDLAHVNASTAEWVNSGNAVTSGNYVQTSFSYPVTAFRLNVTDVGVDSLCKVLVRE